MVLAYAGVCHRVSDLPDESLPSSHAEKIVIGRKDGGDTLEWTANAW